MTVLSRVGSHDVGRMSLDDVRDVTYAVAAFLLQWRQLRNEMGREARRRNYDALDFELGNL